MIAIGLLCLLDAAEAAARCVACIFDAHPPADVLFNEHLEIKDGRMLDAALEDLTTITGQKPVVTKARKSIAGFKLREGMSIGAKATLRCLSQTQRAQIA